MCIVLPVISGLGVNGPCQTLFSHDKVTAVFQQVFFYHKANKKGAEFRSFF